jgi:Phage minor capsid protein 2
MIKEAIDEQKLSSDVELIIQLFRDSEAEIYRAMNGRNRWRDSERQQMLIKIKSILKELEKKTIDITTPLIEEYWNEGQNEVKKALAGTPSQTFQLIDKTVLEFIVTTQVEITSNFGAEVKALMGNTYSNIEKQLYRAKKELQAKLVSEIGKAQIEGKSRKKLERELVELLKSKNILGFSIPSEATKSGVINHTAKSYIHGLTQSSLINSRAAAVVKSALDRGHDLLKISTHSKPSPMCQPWGGTIISITGATKGYPTLNQATFKFKNWKAGAGIFHTYCRHSLYAYIPTDIKFNTGLTPEYILPKSIKN